jgi:hypothetical protein
MAKAGALTKESLAALGAERLADLLLELGEADAAIRKRLVLASAEGSGPDAMTKAIDRRLKALAGSRGFIDWQKARAYAVELDGLRAAIASGLLTADPGAAAERLTQFIGLASSVYERVDDSNGRFARVFSAAVADLVKAWSLTPAADPRRLAEQVFALIRADGYGLSDGLVAMVGPVLGPEGLAVLADLARAAADARPPATRGGTDWDGIRLKMMMRDVADARGDVDAYIAAETAAGGRPDVLGIAERLLEAGRPEDALGWLDRARPARLAVASADDIVAGLIRYPLDFDHAMLRIEALERLGRRPEAQDERWVLFADTLEPDVLRAYIRALDDFKEFDALDQAFALAANHPRVPLAVGFFVAWNRPDHLAGLVESRFSELDGRHYGVLAPAADTLAANQPVTAIRLRRLMIDSVLGRSYSKSYPYAARDLAACAVLADRVDGGPQSHAAYVGDLRAKHGRKLGFWRLVEA